MFLMCAGYIHTHPSVAVAGLEAGSIYIHPATVCSYCAYLPVGYCGWPLA